MGQHRQSQSNDSKNTRRQSGKQQQADPDKTSSRTSGNTQRQQDEDRLQQGDSDGAAPRAGRDADNPSESANQQDRRSTSGKGEH